MTVESNTAAVVIVGAGPTGLLLACELGVRGIAVILVEESFGPSRHPKANTQSARTMEIYRRHGIAARLRQLGLPRDRNTDVAYFSRLFSHELHRVSLPSLEDAERAVRAGDPRGRRWLGDASGVAVTDVLPTVNTPVRILTRGFPLTLENGKIGRRGVSGAAGPECRHPPLQCCRCIRRAPPKGRGKWRTHAAGRSRMRRASRSDAPGLWLERPRS